MSDRLGMIITVAETKQSATLQPTFDSILNSLSVTKDLSLDFPKDVYLTDTYSATNDPFDDLEKARQIAKKQQKSILLAVGQEMDINCRMLDYFIRDNPDIAQLLKEQFVTVKVNYSQANEEFLSQFPLIEWQPHFFILNANGDLLDSIDTRAFERGGYFDRSKFAAFLKKCGLSSPLCARK